MIQVLRGLSKKIFFINDLEEIDFDAVDSKIKKNTYLSLTFAFLLFGSTIVTTLGLLLENSPAVIGGMLISPLMWPLIKIATGIANDRFSYVSKGFWLLVTSIIVSILSAALITYISPIKALNDEILARTNPTFVDLVIALVSGSVAALAITQPKMSESLAGVAIAAALMPPLCVVGIGLAVLDPVIALESFGLFSANVVSIIFVAILVFFLVGFQRMSEVSHIRRRGLIFISMVLAIMSIPLFISLVDYAAEFETPNQIQQVLDERLDQISPAILLEDVSFTKEWRTGEEFVLVRANLQVPQGVIIDYLQQQKIARALEDSLGRKVDLQLILSQTASVVSAEDIETSRQENRLIDRLLQELAEQKPSFEIDNIKVTLGESWKVEAVLSGSPELVFTHREREDLEKKLEEEIDAEVTLDIRIIPSIDLKSSPDLEAERVRQEIEKTVEQSFALLSDEIEVSSMEIMEGVDDENITKLNLEIKVPQGLNLSKEDIGSVKFNLETVFPGRQFSLEVRILEKVVMEV